MNQPSESLPPEPSYPQAPVHPSQPPQAPPYPQADISQTHLDLQGSAITDSARLEPPVSLEHPVDAVPARPAVQPPPHPQSAQPPHPPHTSQPDEREAPVSSAPHPHEMKFEQRRIHIGERQRGTDAAALGNLALHIPNFLCSLLVVGLLSAFFGGFLLVLAWLASGAFVFHRPTESVIARRFLHLRHPTPQERAKLEPVWREVTARAGVEGHNYELWVEDSDDLNAVAAAGHIVGVTRFAMHQLPSGQLAAILAHELGHHIGGHSWSSLLGYWYALPGRVAWRLLRAVAHGLLKAPPLFSCIGGGFFLLFFGSIAYLALTSLNGLPLLLLGIPYLIAAVSRRAELRADQQAALLGFAPMLVEVIGKWQSAEAQALRAAAPSKHSGLPLGQVPAPRQGALAKLLSSHPDHYTRVHHLQPYLQPSR